MTKSNPHWLRTNYTEQSIYKRTLKGTIPMGINRSDHIVHQGRADYYNCRFYWTRPQTIYTLYRKCEWRYVWFTNGSGWDMRIKTHSDKTRIQREYVFVCNVPGTNIELLRHSYRVYSHIGVAYILPQADRRIRNTNHHTQFATHIHTYPFGYTLFTHIV